MGTLRLSHKCGNVRSSSCTLMQGIVMHYKELWAFYEQDHANPVPLLPLCFLLIYWLQLFCLFCYLHPKICPSVFRNSMRALCYLKIDNKRGCLLRNCPALVGCCCCCLDFFICWSLDYTRGNIFAWRPLTVLWRGHGVQQGCCDLQTKAESKRDQGLPYL